MEKLGVGGQEKITLEKVDFHKVFGLLLIYLRKNNYDLEYSILSNVSDINMQNNVIIVGVSDIFGYNKLQSEAKDKIEEFVKKYDYSIEFKIINAQEKINIVDLLKEKFGNYLKIIK